MSEPLDEKTSALVEKAALINATGHGGRADIGAVVGRVLAEAPELRSKAGLVSK